MFVTEALQVWSVATGGKFTFQVVQKYDESNINLIWRRVDRKSLGLCHTEWKNNQIFSAEVEIGISDGTLHAAYNNTDEVKHTIIHEIGHAIGMPHSPYQADIMYVPHQYGVVEISPRDSNTAKWLYSFDPSYNYKFNLPEYGLPATATIDEMIMAIENPAGLVNHQASKGMQGRGKQIAANSPGSVSASKPVPKGLSINDQQQLLMNRNLYNLSLQNIKVDIHQKMKEFKDNGG